MQFSPSNHSNIYDANLTNKFEAERHDSFKKTTYGLFPTGFSVSDCADIGEDKVLLCKGFMN
jgi:hypothetical protein